MNAAIDSLSVQDSAIFDRTASVAEQWRLVEDIQREWETGGAPDAQAALRDREVVSWDKSVVLHLAIREFHLRRQAGESVDVPSFCRKFPDYAASLAPCLEAREALAEFLVPVDWPQCGDVCGGLRVVEELGRGAFARAYLTRDPACGGRLTVLKLSPDGAREAVTLGKLDDPNVVYVHGVVHCPERGLSGLTTRFYGRATLCDLLDVAFKNGGPSRNGRTVLLAASKTQASVQPEEATALPHRSFRHGSYETAALHLARRMSGSLETAHKHGVLHLDLKPSNVLLTPAGEPMLLDFNLSQDAAVPRGPLGGTLPYMAPEMLRATILDEPIEVDARADVYSLGALLYQLLHGRLPFDLQPGQTSPADQARHLLARQRRGPSPPPSSLGAMDGVAKLLAKCLAFEPGDRFASAAELSAALDRELSPAGQAKRWTAKHPRRVLAAAAVALMAFASFGAMNSMRDSPGEDAFKSGAAALKDGSPAVAEQHFSQSLGYRPGHVESLFLRGLARQRQGAKEQALADYRLAGELAPGDGRIMACKAFCLAREAPQFVIDLYRQAIAAGFDNPAVRNNLGYILLLQNRLDDSQRELDHALLGDPQLAQALHSRAVLHMRRAQSPHLGAAQKAEQAAAGTADILRSLELAPGYGEKHRVLANLINAGIDKQVPNPQTVDELFRQLNLAVDNGGDLRSLAADVNFDYLSGDPRFSALLARQIQNPQRANAERFLDPVRDE